MALVLLLFGGILCFSCLNNSFVKEKSSPIVAKSTKSYSSTGISEDRLFLRNDRGTYIYAEIDYPDNLFEGTESEPNTDTFPVVFMSHGFGGSIHSGGAAELGQKLAKAGIIAVRIDFNPYLEPNKNSERTNEYPLSQMESDALLTLDTVVAFYNGDSERIGLYGRSYGGRFSMLMANKSAGGYDFKALGLVAPAGDEIAFVRYLGGQETYDELKKEAMETGYSEKHGIHLTPQWFSDVEDCNPCTTAENFGDKPVLLFYNTLDNVVFPDTAKRCAESYENYEEVEVTTPNGHGYEMSFQESELKDSIMNSLVEFFESNL